MMTNKKITGSNPALIHTHGGPTATSRSINSHIVHLQRPRANFAILVRAHRGVPNIAQPARRGLHRRPSDDGDQEVHQINDRRHAVDSNSASKPSRCTTPRRPAAERQEVAPRSCPAQPPARPCMRWIAQAEVALDVIVDQSLNHFSHRSLRRKHIQSADRRLHDEALPGQLIGPPRRVQLDRRVDDSSTSSRRYRSPRPRGQHVQPVINRSIQVRSSDTPRHTRAAHMYHTPAGPPRRRCRRIRRCVLAQRRSPPTPTPAARR